MPRKKADLSGGNRKVGPGSPPKHTQFKKGTSGNPSGRPLGSKNLATMFQEAADGTVTATIEGKKRKISKLQAALFQLATKAAGGDTASINKFLNLADEMEQRQAAARPAQYPFETADLEVLRAVYERMKLCQPPKAQ